ncbi:MAG: peptidoglycan recognition family protein [Ginsengibacter sp.]
METKYGFTKMSVAEFESWIQSSRVARTILFIQQHHTYSPDYHLCKDHNHFELQKVMKNYHVFTNGWMDMGQHFTIFPDGEIVTGRSLELTPACIYGNNSHSVCIENVGNFDAGGDVMTPKQEEAILRVTAALCKKFNIPVNTSRIVYHHWFNLSTGERNDGTKNNKSCPGTKFFGGNKVEDCQLNFLPRVKALIDVVIDPEITGLVKYVQVTASALSVRSRPDGSSDRVNDRD